MPDGDGRLTRRRFLQASTFVGGTTVLGSPAGSRAQTATDTWPQPRFDAGQTGFNPTAPGPDPDTVEEFWRFGGVSTGVTPIASTDRVFLPAGESILAVDRITGAEDWRTVVGEGITPLATDGDTLCAIDLDGGSITGLDAGDGAVRWTETPSARPGTRPVLADGKVYFGDTDGLRVLDLVDGSDRWSVELDGAVTTPLAVSGDAIYVASGTGLSRYSTDGMHEWDREVLLAGPVPVVDDGMIYAGTVEQRPGSPSLVAIGTDDGDERWRVDRYVQVRRIAAADGRLFVAASLENAEGIFAVDVEDGSENWRVLLDTPVTAPPVVGANHVYVTVQDGRVLALHREHGGQQWERAVGRRGTVGQAVVAGETVYVSSSDAGLVALRGQPTDGAGSSSDDGADGSDSDDGSTAESAGDATEDSSGGDASDGTDGFGSGFGVLGALAGAGLAWALYARRRDSQRHSR